MEQSIDVDLCDFGGARLKKACIFFIFLLDIFYRYVCISFIYDCIASDLIFNFALLGFCQLLPSISLHLYHVFRIFFYWMYKPNKPTRGYREPKKPNPRHTPHGDGR